jgi:hypothetical protein
MREILDPLDPEHLRPVFGDVFRRLQRGKALEPFAYYNGAYLPSLDGTGYFPSQKIHCPSCQVKEHKDGTVTYGHQMLAAVIVHPDIKEVIPLVPEPIQKQDGGTKNDCERKAPEALHLDHRPAHHASQRLGVREGRMRAVAHRERDVQHAEEPGIPLRAQLRARRAELVGGVRHADDAGVSRGSGATTLLPSVPRRLGEAGK